MKNIIKHYDELLKLKNDLKLYIKELEDELKLCKKQITLVPDTDNYWKNLIKYNTKLIKKLGELL